MFKLITHLRINCCPKGTFYVISLKIRQLFSLFFIQGVACQFDRTVYEFFEEHPYATIYLKGSSSSRTKLYQINISNFIEKISIEYDVYGKLEDKFERFNSIVSNTCFLIQKR